jgi:hypothetical protein
VQLIDVPVFQAQRRKKNPIANLKRNTKTKKKCGPWKSGNPNPGFPLFHRPDSLRRKEKFFIRRSTRPNQASAASHRG